MSQHSKKLYEFGAFRLDATERVLWRGDELLVLPPKVFDTLLMLIEQGGRVVSKSELMGAIWADAFVEESNLSQNIYKLRRTLGVDEQGRQLIETIPRRGYRLAVPVKSIDDTATNGSAQTREVIHHNAPMSPTVVPLENGLAAVLAPITNGSPEIAAAPPPPVSPAAPAQEVRPRPGRRHAVWAGSGVLMLALLVVGIYQAVIRRGEKGEPKTAPIEQVRLQRLTNSGDVVFPTISPNGELLAYVRHEEHEESVWVKQITSGSSVQTLPPSRRGYRSLVFSPDGKYLYFREESNPGAIYQTSIFGGAPKALVDNVWSDFSVSPDGQQFAFFRRDPGRNAHLLMLSNIDGSGGRELSVRQAPLDYRGGAPAWSPDGARLVVAAGLQQQFTPKLLMVDVATGQEAELKTPNWRAITRVLWTPNGSHLIVAARAANEAYSQLWMLAYPDGEIRRLTNDLEAYFWLSLSADGRMLVTRQQRLISHLWLLPEGDAARARQLTSGERNLDGYTGLAWTPGGRVVFSVFAGRNTDLYSMNPDGTDRVQLTANAGQDNTGPWTSPDGRYIVFTSNRTGTTQIWRMDADGRNQKQLTFAEGESESTHFPALSGDGREVFFIKHGAGPAAIWKVPLDGGAAVQVSRLSNATAEGFLSASPDGRWLAYQHVADQPEASRPSYTDERTMRVGVLPADGGGEPRLFDLSMRRPMVQWSANATAFDYSAGTFNASSLWRQSLDGGKPQKLFDLPDRVFNFAWSADHKHLVVSRGRQQGDAILITNLP